MIISGMGCTLRNFARSSQFLATARVLWGGGVDIDAAFDAAYIFSPITRLRSTAQVACEIFKFKPEEYGSWLYIGCIFVRIIGCASDTQPILLQPWSRPGAFSFFFAALAFYFGTFHFCPSSTWPASSSYCSPLFACFTLAASLQRRAVLSAQCTNFTNTISLGISDARTGLGPGRHRQCAKHPRGATLLAHNQQRHDPDSGQPARQPATRHPDMQIVAALQAAQTSLNKVFDINLNTTSAVKAANSSITTALASAQQAVAINRQRTLD
ncbi:hypothetical protein B0H16DRAFT_1723355 [Mycena metata]|uniref:Uncharacterized protein n=1 Tax=Mycena metata TaxID=1033252 RepID=A0AAD7NB50_9AGAR|nr:hypothetical protein B0H16DRAFT_1723355 [Mycena metata]